MVVITGSATGIGAATARRFAAEGARVAFLASDDARYLTGQAIEVDGGLVLS